MGYLRGMFGKKKTGASEWIQANKPAKLVKKSPCKLSTVATYDQTGLPIFDNLFRPAVGIIAGMAKLNNALQHIMENLKVFGAMTEGIPSVDSAAGEQAGLPTFVIKSADGGVIVTVGADGVAVTDKVAWTNLVKSCKKVDKLCTSLAEWLKYLSLIIDKHAESASTKTRIKVADGLQFPEISGDVSDRAPWVSRLVKVTTPTCFGYCTATIEREMLLDELLRRKRAQTIAGRRGMKREAAKVIKLLKKERDDAQQIYDDKAKLREAFDANDKDNSGQIDFDELTALLKKLGIEKEPHEVEEMMAAADKDGSGTVDFNEFANVQKEVADTKEAEYQTWFTQQDKIQIRNNGCVRADKKPYKFLQYKSSTGSRLAGKGVTIERKLVKELLEEQKKLDPTVKGWAKGVNEAVKIVNLLILHLRHELVHSSKTKFTPAIVIDKVRAMLTDFAKQLGIGGGKGMPSIRFTKEFQRLFQGKNPITGMVLITADGQEVDFKSKGGGSASNVMQWVYNVFFNLQHPNNLVNIFGTIATSVAGMVKNFVKLGLRVANTVRQCLPPFPIIPVIYRQVIQLCTKGAMSLDFKVRKVPFKILRAVRTFATFPMITFAFAKSSKELLTLMGGLAAGVGMGGAQAALDLAKKEKVDASQMGDEFKKGQTRAADAGSVAKEASGKQGELKLSKEEQEEEKAGGDDDDDPDDEDDPSHATFDLSDEALETKFAEIDIDCDGNITPVELKQAITESGKKRTAQEVALMMKEADTDGNGEIDLEEFMNAMRLDTSMAA